MTEIVGWVWLCAVVYLTYSGCVLVTLLILWVSNAILREWR